MDLIKNAQAMTLGDTANRYTQRILKLSSYLYIRGGQFLYNFLSPNCKLPCLKTVQRFMEKDLIPLMPDVFDFNGLENFVRDRNLSMSVGISSDAAKIVENVVYESSTNTLLGLVSPINSTTGLPTPNFHKACNAQQILESMSNYPKATMVECIIARANTTNSPTFLLGYFFTNLSYKFEDKMHRMEYIYNELSERGLKLLCESTDGDPTSLGAQKRSMNFGVIYSAFGMELAADFNSKIISNQDPEHILKKMKNVLFSRILRIGMKNATIAHLEMVINTFPKAMHGLIKSDLNAEDRMDYR